MISAAALLLLVPMSQASAATSPLVPGARVRVTARVPGQGHVTHVGSLRTFDSANLTMLPSGSATPQSFTRQSIVGLDVSRGERRRTGTGLLLGTVLGLSAIALLDATCEPDCNRKDAVTVGLIGGGALLGTVVGAMMKTERWEPVRWAIGVRRAAAPVRSPRRPLALALSVRF